ncbi:helix-turn-helix domain-containing protein [Oleidesulfovibrio sp.]|uniref:helix-turn-helix domain-containing protein n=1 Tax=Oleidesulfovibrio sp. TaxID=2909707 RepID=UPI003A86F4F7
MHKRNSLEKCWLTEREVAEITGLSISTLQKQRLFCRGIPYSKVGKSVRYAYDDVMAFMWAARIDPAGNQTSSAPATRRC